MAHILIGSKNHTINAKGDRAGDSKNAAVAGAKDDTAGNDESEAAVVESRLAWSKVWSGRNIALSVSMPCAIWLVDSRRTSMVFSKYCEIDTRLLMVLILLCWSWRSSSPTRPPQSLQHNHCAPFLLEILLGANVTGRNCCCLIGDCLHISLTSFSG